MTQQASVATDERRVFVDKQTPGAYKAFVAAAESVRAALRAGETPQRLAVLPAWRDTELFTARERAALALAEATTRPADAAAQSAAYAQARGVLSDDEVSAVIWVAISINAFNRVSVLSKHPVRGAAPAPVSPA